MGFERTIPLAPEHPDRLLALSILLQRFDSDELQRAVDLIIAVRDALDGDLDLEPNGDERDVGVAAFACSSPYRPDDRIQHHRDADIAASALEDDEDGDPAEDDDPREPDDPQEDDDGDEEDERERAEEGSCAIFGLDQRRYVSSEYIAADTLFAANAS